jgi:hypothetical protein
MAPHKKTPAQRRGSSYSVARRMPQPFSNGGANNEAVQDLRPVLLLESVLPRAITQPPLDGVAELLVVVNRPSPAPGVPRFLGFGHVCHVAPFLADGRRRLTTIHLGGASAPAVDTDASD